METDEPLGLLCEPPETRSWLRASWIGGTSCGKSNERKQGIGQYVNLTLQTRQAGEVDICHAGVAKEEGVYGLEGEETYNGGYDAFIDELKKT